MTIKYGGVGLHVASAEVAAWIESQIPPREAFSFFRPRSFGNPNLNPRAHFAWVLNRPFRLNSLFMPWGASRWGYAFVLADDGMRAAIAAQNPTGTALPFCISDGVGNSVSTDMLQLPAVSLSNIIAASPALGLWLLPLADERLRFWEATAPITVDEGTTTWTDLYEQIAEALLIDLTVDPVNSAYGFPGAGLGVSYDWLPLLLDWTAASCGQRIVRNMDGTFNARNASTAASLQIAQANQFRKYAGGALQLGLVSA
jgi:hypothetical protein